MNEQIENLMIRYDGLYEYAHQHGLDYNVLCCVVRAAITSHPSASRPAGAGEYIMNERIKELAEQAEGTKKHVPAVWQFYDHELEKFVELIKQAIYADVKGELMDDAIINQEPASSNREYLRGCNGGTVDALCHIKNFGIEIEE